ncbi:MAG: alpha-1,2-fucosyltransferase [Lachnospiraceae bacterium]|jgi:hypothetical protein|nr:alpha-1,2-fucosyltransferase [Lachnospiraceae bacterium]
MIIIRMKGGLGNQLFQYALYLELARRGREVKMDETGGFREDSQRDPALSVFGIDYERASDKEIRTMCDAFMDPLSRIRRKLTGRKSREFDEREHDGCFDPRVFELEDAYLAGYWQTAKYFPDPQLQAELYGQLTARESSLLSGCRGRAGTAGDLLGKLAGRDSVAVHIRRGDYLQVGTAETFGGICTEDYYRSAVDLVGQSNGTPVFYAFSNDPAWVRESLPDMLPKGAELVVADDYAAAAEAGDDARDSGAADAVRVDAAQLLLMSHCRHRILANSSFSWWGNWIARRRGDGNAAQGLTVAPKYWINGKKMDDIYTADMIRL